MARPEPLEDLLGELRSFVSARLSVAVEEILGAVGRTVVRYKHEFDRQRTELKDEPGRVFVEAPDWPLVRPPQAPGPLFKQEQSSTDVSSEQEEFRSRVSEVPSFFLSSEPGPELAPDLGPGPEPGAGPCVPAPGAQKKVRYHCPFCGKAFTKTDNFKCHLRAHTGEKPFSCSECGKRFAYHASFNNHRRAHTGERPFSCSVCAKAFALKSVLKQHMFTHQEHKPFSCSVCAKGFCNKQGLRQHQSKHCS